MKKTIIRVCAGHKCTERGADNIAQEIKKNFDKGEVERCECMGYCEVGPNVVMDEEIFHECKRGNIVARLNEHDGKKIIKPKFDELDLEII